MNQVSEKELRIIEELSKSSSLTQRELSGKANLSLGAVNLILKRLVKRGFIKTKGLTQKKIDYILTPKGFSEKANKSISYFKKTIDLVKKVRAEIAKVVLAEFNNGQKKFIILGNDDLADIIELALKGFNYSRINSVKDLKEKDSLILISSKNVRLGPEFRSINIAEKLSSVYWGVD